MLKMLAFADGFAGIAGPIGQRTENAVARHNHSQTVAQGRPVSSRCGFRMDDFPDPKPTILLRPPLIARWQGLSTEQKALGEGIGAISSILVLT
jgi:hypothetical protein